MQGGMHPEKPDKKYGQFGDGPTPATLNASDNGTR